jgi:hypothetical protein
MPITVKKARTFVNQGTANAVASFDPQTVDGIHRRWVFDAPGPCGHARKCCGKDTPGHFSPLWTKDDGGTKIRPAGTQAPSPTVISYANVHGHDAIFTKACDLCKSARNQCKKRRKERRIADAKAANLQYCKECNKTENMEGCSFEGQIVKLDYCNGSSFARNVLLIHMPWLLCRLVFYGIEKQNPSFHLSQ